MRRLSGLRLTGLLPVGALLGASFLAPAAVAQPVSFRVDSGVAIEARWAVAFPMNDRARATGASLPLGIELGYRFTPRVQAGLSLRYSSKTTSDSPVRVTAFGANVRYHAAPGTGLDPWVGFGMAYQMVRFRDSSTGSVTAREGGFQFGVLEAGADMPFTRSFWVGPYLGVSLGRYAWAGYGVRFNLLL